MPLYMDRHDLPGATAADIATAHLRDLEVQERFGVRFVTYWFEEEAGSGFCLIEGPDKESVEAAHRASHGMLPLNVVEVDEASIRGFFGRLNTHPPGEPYVESAFRAILFTDMVDSTRLTQQLGDREAMQLVRQHDSIVRSGLAQFGGSEVKHTGDGIMAAFDAASPAVGAAVQIQRALGELNAGGQSGLRVRIGVAAGEPRSVSPAREKRETKTHRTEQRLASKPTSRCHATRAASVAGSQEASSLQRAYEVSCRARVSLTYATRTDGSP
jgi:hypothetical protein